MSVGSLAFLAVAAALIVALPRRWAVIPLLLAAAYTTRVPVVELGPANLSVLRVLVVIGLARVVVRGERFSNGMNAIDGWLFAWASYLILTSAFHTSDAWTYRMGMVLGELGVYVLFRVFIQDADDLRRVFRFVVVALLPLSLLMLAEKAVARNFFDVMGGSSEVIIREGHVRAAGPFGHAVLAGTVGATIVPMAMALWRTHRWSALIGLVTGGAMLIACTSSTPIMMLIYVLVAMSLWQAQNWMRVIRWTTVAALIALQMVMHDPVYFLMARIDITGGSTGYYRAQLVRSSIVHLNEWWLAGTDYTRHWMGSGILANDIHADIVNHFLAMGVMGGLPLMFLFIMVIWSGFRRVGQGLTESQSPNARFLSWTLGSMLFADAMGFWAFSPFDQSVTFFYLIFAGLGAIALPVAVAARQPAAVTAGSLQGVRLAAPAAFAGKRAATPALARRTQSIGSRG